MSFVASLLLIELLLLLGRGRAFGAARGTSPRDPFRWMVVGGGPHGVHIAARLLDVPGVTRAGLCIVDDEPTLLRKWKRRTAATGMVHLRSSAAHHLDVEAESLRRFATRVGRKSPPKDKRKPSLFAADYQRPRLDFFNEHCDHVIETHRLGPLHVQGRVSDVIPNEHHVEVNIARPDGGTLKTYAEHVVLALGSDAPTYPDWVTQEMRMTGKVKHVFDEQAPLDPQRKSIAIVGGGISAAHLALAHCKTHDLHVICRHDIREQQFDTHQDWMMDAAAAQRSLAGGGQGLPKCRRRFASLDSLAERRNVIRRERVAGTIPAAISRGQGGLRYLISSGQVRYHKDQIRHATLIGRSDEGRGQISLSLESGDEIAVDQIVLATGFSTSAPASVLIRNIAERNDLKLSPCGYPAPDESLKWHERLYVAGSLAELQLGPSARNLAGARLSSERIVSAAAAATTTTTTFAA